MTERALSLATKKDLDLIAYELSMRIVYLKLFRAEDYETLEHMLSVHLDCQIDAIERIQREDPFAPKDDPYYSQTLRKAKVFVAEHEEPKCQRSNSGQKMKCEASG